MMEIFYAESQSKCIFFFYFFIFFLVVWNFFEKHESKVRCKFENCNLIMSYGTTSMAKHLAKAHNMTFKKKDEPKITQFATNYTSTPLSKSNSDEVVKKLSLSLAQSTAPFRLVENENFRAALNILNPSFTVPSHQTIGRVVDSCYQNLITIIKSKLENASHVSICADFWTGKNMVGYLGVLASFIEDCQRKDVLIALREVPYPHTRVVVKESLDAILNNFGFNGSDDTRIVSISTDNGSNMVAGLREMKSNYKEAAAPEENTENHDCVDDLSDDDDFSVDEEEADFDFTFPKRIPCLNHLLNNNLKTIVPKNEEVMALLNKTKDMIKKIRFKGVVNDFCRKNKLPKLLLPPLTRWRYYYHMCKSVLNARLYLPEICSLARIDNLTIRDFEMLESLCQIFEQYEHLNGIFEKKNSKISDTIPSIISLWLKLNSNVIFKDFCQDLINDLVKRTQCIFDTNSIKFTNIFAVSTFIDPSTKKYFNITETPFNLTTLKTYVITNLSNLFENDDCPKIPKASKMFEDLDQLLNESSSPDELKM